MNEEQAQSDQPATTPDDLAQQRLEQIKRRHGAAPRIDHAPPSGAILHRRHRRTSIHA
jgi:hypothetical protein